MMFIKDGFHLRVGQTEQSWFLIGLSYNNVDEDFVEHRKGFALNWNKYSLKSGKTMEEWMRADAAQKRKLFILEEGECVEEMRVLSTSDRIYGPAVPYETVEKPTAVWIEKDEAEADKRYRIMLLEGNSRSVITASRRMLRKPSVASTDLGVYTAFLVDENDKTWVKIIDSTGRILYAREGRDPVIRTDGTRVFLLYDTAKPNVIMQNLEIIDLEGELITGFYDIRADDLNFSSDMRYNPNTDILSMVWETAPVWGADPAVGYHRDLAYAEIDLKHRHNRIIPEIVPVKKCAYYELQDGKKPRYSQNAAPVNPRIIFNKNIPTIAYRTFAFIGRRTFGWDIYAIEKKDNRWGKCRKLSDRYGPPDTGYDVLFRNDKRITFMTVNHSVNAPKAIYDVGILIDEQKKNFFFPDTHIPFIARGFYNIGFPLPNAAPPIKEENHEGYRLVWADLHVHTCYSKCQANKDGTPIANLRFTRDILGNKVLSLVEHYHFMSAAEVAWSMDRLEEEAGDNCLYIYGNEALGWPSHDTNVYSIDRSVQDRLRMVVISTVHRSEEAYPAIKKYLPKGSVIAIRHFHGRHDGEYSVTDPKTVHTHDAELELSMEAIQIRGNFMQEQSRKWYDEPLFPNNFLNAGKKVGVVGGSDHSTAPRNQNAFALTGFWIKDFSKEAAFEAIKQRRTFAAANGKVSVWCTLNGQPMGAELEIRGEINIEVKMRAYYPIIRVSLMMDGEIIEKKDLEDGAREADVAFNILSPKRGSHWYSVHVQAYSAHTIDDRYPVDDLDYPWIIVNTSPWFVDVGG